jgi:amino acid adenylation domain-containing protein
LPALEGPALLHEWLHGAATRYPDQPAVVEPGLVLTLRQLQERSSSIAAAFRRQGLEPGDRVGLVMEKSADAITAMFATLCAGGAYVPIQPDWPRGRIDAVLDDCGARLVVADADSDGDAPPSVVDRRSGATLSWLDCLGARPQAAAVNDRSPEDPAFILFTSGSTGVPKGVTISHRAVGAFVDWSARHFRLSTGDRILCPSPLSFDLSTFDVFNIARSGSTCLIAPRATTWVPRLLLELAREQRATVWYSVPSLLMHMMERGGLERDPLSSLRVILFAGEVMPPHEAARLGAAHRQAEIYNLYGPTETNVVTWYRLPEDPDSTRPVPIGQPCPYASVRLEPAVEEPGSGAAADLLLVAGESLMSGYWNRPEETARAFADIDDERGRTRYYRTGDRVILDPGGEMRFAGRADRQVKRRGYRIELGEIEAALGSQPDLAEVALVAAGEGSVRLSAFVRARAPNAPSDLELRAHCARFLPSYMIPDRFLKLQEMPRGNRGKIDYAALARLDRDTP